MAIDTHLESLFAQLPGCWGCKDKDSVFVYANQAYGNLIGVDSHLDCIGRTDFEMPSPTTECAGDFQAQDRAVMETRNTMRVLDIHPYPDGRWRAHIFTKTPWLDDNGGVQGTIFYGQELEDTAILEVGHWICRATGLSKADRHVFGEQLMPLPEKLNQRESQVLFLLLYGKKPQFIANAMEISVKTVEGHVARLRGKFGANSKNELIEIALDAGYGSVIPESLLRTQISVVLTSTPNSHP